MGLEREKQWTILFGPLFQSRFDTILAEVRDLKKRLQPGEYRKHPSVKLYAALDRLIWQIIPTNPDAPEYRLHKPLAKFRRAKKLFWVTSSRLGVVIILWLNDFATLRKAKAKTDPYVVFTRMVGRGDIGQDFEDEYQKWRRLQR